MIELVVWLVIVGVVLWLINNVVSIDSRIKTIINVVVILAVCVYLLRAFGILDMPVPRLR